MTDPKDYTQRSWIAGLALIAVLAAVGFIPPAEVCGVSLRRANILSEVLTFDDAPAAEETAAGEELELPEVDWESVSRAVAEQRDTVRAHEVRRTFVWYAAGEPEPADETADETAQEEAETELAAWPAGDGPAVAIEDFDTTGTSPLKGFYRKLAERKPVRIAFLGDSFIEGDILTADLREALQLRFGGSGAGFAPVASPLTGFRRTVKTQSKGWTTYNVMQQAKAPADVRPLFTVSGWVSLPAAGASTRWEMADARQCLTPTESARIWFRSTDASRVEVVVNDTLRQTFTVEGDEALREIAVHHPELRTLDFKVLSGAKGFVGYGACFRGEEGVAVDNYSVRSNNGRALFWTSPALNAQLQALAGYDLVVLQYGLNIMQQGVHGYAKYCEQLKQMVTYVRECFPGAAVLVLGVSERYVKGEEGFRPMDAIPSMIRWQRRAAEETGAAFWSTAEAMQALGGMERFVAQGWAGKDYTHINYGGGRQIARSLYDALCAGAAEAAEELLRERVRREELEPVLDPVRVDSLLFGRTIDLIP